jgi:DNA-binding NarL/FixJ family response regulator
VLRLVIADDNAAFRIFVRQILEGRYQVVGEAADGQTALRILAEYDPDVLLLNLALPGIKAFELARLILEHDPCQKIVAITAATGAYALHKIASVGFDAVLPEAHARPEILAKTVESVGMGARLGIVGADGQRLRHPPEIAGLLRMLTKREEEVLSLIGLFLSDSEIGHRLKISARTANTFRARLMKKVGVHSSVHLTRFAIQHGYSVFPPEETDGACVRDESREVGKVHRRS